MNRCLKTLRVMVLPVLVAACVPAGPAPDPAAPSHTGAIVAHPDQLVFPPLEFQPPDAADHRFVLDNGVVCYLARHDYVPLVRIEATVLTDADQEPAGLTGLNTAFFRLLEEGGGNGLDPAAFEDRVAFLGARFWSRPTARGGVVGIEVLQKDVDEGLDLLFGQLKAPAFDAQRLELWRSQSLADLRQRNDDTRRLERLEWTRLIHSPDHTTGRLVTASDITNIDREALLDWQRRFAGPAGVSFEISGAIDITTASNALAARFAGWNAPTKPVPARGPVYRDTAPGVYIMDKAVNQTRVRLALPGLERNDPRWLAGEVLNTLLGGGFTSRLVQRIRSDEGLAYSVWSSLAEEEHGKGLFLGGMQTKAESTLYAMSLYREELRRIAEGDLQQAEVDRVRQGMIEEFSGLFNTPAAVVSVLHTEELSGRRNLDPTYYQDYRQRLAAVDRDAVVALAKQLFTGPAPIWLLIGDAAAIAAGDGQHALALEDFGPVTRIPLRDPLSQVPLD